jgi:hypothetical protein
MAVIPAADWPLVFGSMQALKGHVQEYPGCQKLEAFVELEGSDYRVHCYTTWDTPEQLEVFLERGYTFERMLADVGLQAEPPRMMEKVVRWPKNRAARPARWSATATSARTSVTHGRRWFAPGSSSPSSSCSISAGR